MPCYLDPCFVIPCESIRFECKIENDSGKHPDCFSVGTLLWSTFISYLATKQDTGADPVRKPQKKNYTFNELYEEIQLILRKILFLILYYLPWIDLDMFDF